MTYEMKCSWLVVFAFAFLVFRTGHTDGTRILGFFPSPSKSHQLVHCAVAQALAEAGHNVTVITGMPDVYKKPKYHHVQIGNALMGEEFVKEMVNKPEPFYKKFPSLISHMSKLSVDSITHPDMVRFMRDEKDSFDLVIVGYFINDFHFGLASHFNCPLVVSLMVQPMLNINQLLGNPPEYAYVPTLLSGLKTPLYFFDRVKNFLANAIEGYALGTILNYVSGKLYKYVWEILKLPALFVIM